MNTVTELLQPVENDLDDLILELKNLIGAGHPILQAAANICSALEVRDYGQA